MCVCVCVCVCVLLLRMTYNYSTQRYYIKYMYSLPRYTRMQIFQSIIGMFLNYFMLTIH